MNRKWNGFLPQNELVKLAWAALEESQSVCLNICDACYKPESHTEDTEEQDDEPQLFVQDEI